MLENLNKRCEDNHLPARVVARVEVIFSNFLSELDAEYIEKIKEEQMCLLDIHRIYCRDHGDLRGGRKLVVPFRKKRGMSGVAVAYVACSCGYNCTVRKIHMPRNNSHLVSNK